VVDKGIRTPDLLDANEYTWAFVASSCVGRARKPQVIPEGAGPVKTYFGRVFVRSAIFLVLVGRIEAGVGVKARAEPDRVAAVGP
jgi:hypothetical protein